MSDDRLELTFPPALIDAIAMRVVELAQEQGLLAGDSRSPLMTVAEAAEYIRGEKQRVYDLIHSGALVPERDGRRVLLRRETLDAYLRGEVSDGQ